jgi:hypothetical protein
METIVDDRSIVNLPLSFRAAAPLVGQASMHMYAYKFGSERMPES